MVSGASSEHSARKGGLTLQKVRASWKSKKNVVEPLKRLIKSDTDRGFAKCWPSDLYDVAITMPTSAGKTCVEVMVAWAQSHHCHASCGDAIEHSAEGLDFYRQVIELTWRSVLDRAAGVLKVLRGRESYAKLEKKLEDLEQGSNSPVLYEQLYAQYERKVSEILVFSIPLVQYRF